MNLIIVQKTADILYVPFVAANEAVLVLYVYWNYTCLSCSLQPDWRSQRQLTYSNHKVIKLDQHKNPDAIILKLKYEFKVSTI